MKRGFVKLLTITMLAGAIWLLQPDAAWAAPADDAAAVQQRLASEVKLSQERGGVKSGALESLEKVQKGGVAQVDGLAGLEMASLILEQKRFAYQVEWGDTLNKISASRSTTVEEIKDLNNLKGDEIIAGQKLVLPVKAALQPSRGGDGGRDDSVPGSAESATKGRLADWWTDASKVFGLYEKAMVTDVETGKSFWVQRRGGSKHADSQPLTTKDTAIMKQIYGGEWSWARRAIVVAVDNQNLAASMNGMPHGDGALDNGFPGHFCIHFLNSRTHGTDNLDPQHQAMVQKAAGN